MMRSLLKNLTVLFLCIHVVHVYAQSDGGHPQKKPLPQKLNFNHTKLELVYKQATITTTYTNSRGFSHSYSSIVEQPFIRVNDAKPQEIGKHAEFLRSFFTHCNQADEQIDQFNEELRKARTWRTGGILGGLGFFGAGLGMAASSKSNGLGYFIGGVVLCSATAITGTLLARQHVRASDEHLRLSVDIYNSQCYKPLPSDTTKPKADTTHPRLNSDPTETITLSDKPLKNAAASDKKYYNDADSTKYELVRNDPYNSNMYGVTISPVSVDGSKTSFNFSYGAGAFFTYRSLIGLSVDYKRAYWDDVHSLAKRNEDPGELADYGVPAHYQKSSSIDTRAKVSLFTWESDGSYPMHLGRTRIAGYNADVVGDVTGKVLHAVTGRVGYIYDNRLLENTNGLQLTTTTPAYNYTSQGQTTVLTATFLPYSAIMVKSNIVAVGVGLSSFRDIKINLLDETFKGRRELKRQGDFFVDVLYAKAVDFQDVVYYHAVNDVPTTDNNGHIPQRIAISSSPYKKVGWRIGGTYTAMNSFFGTKTWFEAGFRPGPLAVNSSFNFYAQIGMALVFGGRFSLNQ